tara:strand:+ start:1983 stop:2210 length:228 start_codon:yes stop_codon:yes gene_type:complete
MATGECPSNHIPGFSFTSHVDCVENGYRVAHNTFKALEEIEEFDRENNKIVVKFECQQIRIPEPIMPRIKPKIST